MTVLQCLDSLNPVYGGLVCSASALCRALAEVGGAVTLFCNEPIALICKNQKSRGLSPYENRLDALICDLI